MTPNATLVRFSTAMTLPVVMVACGSSSGSGTSTSEAGPNGSQQGDAGFLSSCQFNVDCASDYCQPTSTAGYCSMDCSPDGGCPSVTLCSGNGVCVVSCTASSSCADCACPTGDRCAADAGCVPLSDVGGPCAVDSDCKSGNCGVAARVCDVPVGSPCDATDCAFCETWTSGTSYCSRLCASDSDCSGFGGFCNNSQCSPQCTGYHDPSCGGTCVMVPGTNNLICQCDTGDSPVPKDCTVSAQKAALGSSCSDADCASGDCFFGVCTQTCAGDADCGAGFACVACAGCGDQCFATCDGNTPCAFGQCSSGTDAMGGAVQFCDPHLPLGAACSLSTDCISGRCGASRTCIPAAGIPTGQQCATMPEDCASGQCCNGECC